MTLHRRARPAALMALLLAVAIPIAGVALLDGGSDASAADRAAVSLDRPAADGPSAGGRAGPGGNRLGVPSTLELRSENLVHASDLIARTSCLEFQERRSFALLVFAAESFHAGFIEIALANHGWLAAGRPATGFTVQFHALGSALLPQVEQLRDISEKVDLDRPPFDRLLRMIRDQSTRTSDILRIDLERMQAGEPLGDTLRTSFLSADEQVFSLGTTVQQLREAATGVCDEVVEAD